MEFIEGIFNWVRGKKKPPEAPPPKPPEKYPWAKELGIKITPQDEAKADTALEVDKEIRKRAEKMLSDKDKK